MTGIPKGLKTFKQFVAAQALQKRQMSGSRKSQRKTTARTTYSTRQSIPEPTVVCVVPEFSDAGAHDINAQTMIP